MQNGNEEESRSEQGKKNPWWTVEEHHQLYLLIFLIGVGLLLEGIVHYYLRISIVYTHFFYLIIVIAGLWYGRRAVWLALFFGTLQVFVTYLITANISEDSVLRAAMLCIVAFVVGSIVDRMNRLHARLLDQCHKTKVLNKEISGINTDLEVSRSAYESANRKLGIMNSITRHDILNQLTPLMMYIDLGRAENPSPEIRKILDHLEKIGKNIQRQIEFTRDYQNIGIHTPLWQNLETTVRKAASPVNLKGTELILDIPAPGYEVFADSLLEKVFYNLIENAIRHGEGLTKIRFSAQVLEGNLVFTCEDDGVGVPEEFKERIFRREYYKNTGFGLYLSREILGIAGATIRETGTYRKGARFEIIFPVGKNRVVENSS